MMPAYCAAILLLLASHYVKVLRWGLMTNTYNETRLTRLMRGLCVGYVVNFFVPLRAGEVVRAYIAGRKSNSGFLFFFATVLIERVLDVVFVFLLFLCMWLFGFSPAVAKPLAIDYSVMLAAVVAVAGTAYLLRRPLKRVVLWVAAIFNPHIELQGLTFAWSAITLVKDFFRRIDKLWFVLLSLVMWGGYLASYYFFVQAVAGRGVSYMELLVVLFGPGNLFDPQILPIAQLAGGDVTLILLFSGYIIAPLAILLLLSRLLKKHASAMAAPIKRFFYKEGGTANVIPIADPKSRLEFLTGYFSGKRSTEYVEAYVAINRDIYVLQDLAGGSAATTVQILRDGNVSYRKYAFGADGDALRRQTEWMRDAAALPQARVTGRFENPAGFCYDMEYDPAARDFFTWMHSTGTDEAWGILRQVLADVEAHLHAPTRRAADGAMVQRYVEEKVFANLDLLHKSALFGEIKGRESLTINGVAYPDLDTYSDVFGLENLMRVFAVDEAANIHGDVTVENIIFAPGRPGRYYLIDPNPENLHNTPFIDYAKLLQSLHYGYEFLAGTPALEAGADGVVWPAMRSGTYDELLGLYRGWLAEKFSAAQLKSIYHHEVVNVLRLLPHQMRKKPDTAMLYYASLLMLLDGLRKEGWL